MPPRSYKSKLAVIKKSGDDDNFVNRAKYVVRESIQYLRSKVRAHGKKVLSRIRNWAWLVSTTVLVLYVPLMINRKWDDQAAELEKHRETLLGAQSEPLYRLR
ncbi:hypothetical protein KP509_13G062700 [Ceratopteris richardii]|uniref:Mitochondrial import receptor subunit TOM22 n=1 Tax=Ceratopteris richardii TaxID=49495 RepID=A0A8T2TJB8_CERRI|nr:hypothetical protein KP509_13G062700 [Ceratopteris richardii]